MLPFSAEDIAATRAWLAMTQLARDDEAIGEAIGEVLAPCEAREVEIITPESASPRSAGDLTLF